MEALEMKAPMFTGPAARQNAQPPARYEPFSVSV
jgi:hypothetical protein